MIHVLQYIAPLQYDTCFTIYSTTTIRYVLQYIAPLQYDTCFTIYSTTTIRYMFYNI